MSDIVSGMITAVSVLLLLAWLASISGLLAGVVLILVVILFVGGVSGSTQGHSRTSGVRNRDQKGGSPGRLGPVRLSAPAYVGG